MNEIITKGEAQVAPIPDAPETPMAMISRAVANGASIEIIERLMTLHERWEEVQSRRAFDLAIAAAKAEIPPIMKNREVDFTSKSGVRTNYRYEDFAGIANVVDPILARHGLSYRFRSEQSQGLLTVTCILAHRDGHFEETALAAPHDSTGNKNVHQAVASAATYLQRYTLKLALGLAASEDDDGQAAEPEATITAEQFQTLRDKLEGSGSDEGQFLRFFGAEDLHTFPAAKFDDAVRALDQKAKANAKRGDANA